MNIVEKPGFCPVILNCLKMQTTKMERKEKFCILSFDEMCLKSSVHYNEKIDQIIGFEQAYNLEKNENPKLATKALVFLARGLIRNWKQIIGFFFTSNSVSSLTFKKMILEAIGYLEMWIECFINCL